jgi:hypothetical protein
MAEPYKVRIVVDREFGERLLALPRGEPVWIVDSPANEPVVQQLWNDSPDESHLTGITAFKDMEASSPEQMLIAELGAIELHHGPDSANPPFTLIEVLGTPLTDNTKNALIQYGFDNFQENSIGFIATRREPPGSLEILK